LPGREFTPNEKYAALVETAGYLPLALSEDTQPARALANR
jgi:putative transposase